MGEYLASMGPAVANHLWQSTAFAVVAAGLALALKKNHARARYWVWMAASVKFVVPFAVLAGMVGHFAKPRVEIVAGPPGVYVAVEDVSEPFAGAAPAVVSPAAVNSTLATMEPSPRWGTRVRALVRDEWVTVVAVVWGVGFVTILAAWGVRWRRVARMVCAGAAIEAGREVEMLRRVKAAAGVRQRIVLRVCEGAMEPGVFGIWRPVLAWPAGISARLDDAQMEAVLAHEVSHVRRWDNLTAAMHMFVEAAFWFHPLVWWMGARLVEERERACDEAVMALGGRPEAYAQSILQVCEFCVESPLECMAGVTGADLKQRVMEIMTRRAAHRLSLGKKVLLVAAVVCAAAVPVVLGQAQAARRMMLAAVAKAPMPVRVWAAAHAMIAEEQTPSTGLIAEVQADGAAALPPKQSLNGAPDDDALGPEFEVATIRPANHNDDGPRWIGYRIDASGRFTTSAMPLTGLVRTAYIPQPAVGNVSGGPKWVQSDTFDISAKVDEAYMSGWDKLSNAERLDRVRPMIRRLLADRFQLKLRVEMQPTPVYALVQAKGGAKMKEVPAPDPVEGDPMEALARQMRDNPGKPLPGVIHCSGNTCTGTAVPMRTAIGQIRGSSHADRIVIDETGLKGYYTFTFTQPRPNDDSAMAEIEDDLGLKFEPRTVPMKTYIIDSAEKPSVDGAEVDPTHRDEAAMNGAPRDLKQELHGVYKVWLDQDVRWVISDQEAEAFKRLTNDEERDKFIEQFWQIRNPTPDAAGNAYRDQYYARIAWANEHFAENEPGWMTDRGHVYIVYGKPDEVYAQPGVGAETWTYRHIVGVGDNVVLKFAFVAGLGPHRLVPPLPVGLFGQAADPTGMQGPNPLKRRLSAAAVLAEQSNPPRQSLDRAPGPGAAARPQFEVASVKPVANDRFSRGTRDFVRNEGRPGEIAMAGPDRVRLQNSTLLDLIATAYSVRTTQVSGPTWLSDQGFDIEAKVPEGAPKGELNAMLQSLLEQRFGLKVHRGTQAGPGFALVVGKDGPKLSPAKPPAAPVEGLTDEEQKAQLQQKMQADMAVQHKRMQAQLAAVGRFNNVGWSSITTEELAAQLVRFVGAPVIDETGLTGEYKVTIDTWNNPDVPGGTIFDAVEKLGLKLEPRKVTIETVVVDEVSKTPTAN